MYGIFNCIDVKRGTTMEINSTSKMLASMVGKNKSKSIVSDNQTIEPFNPPQLKPSSDMENVLTQILGASPSKKHSPMD